MIKHFAASLPKRRRRKEEEEGEEKEEKEGEEEGKEGRNYSQATRLALQFNLKFYPSPFLSVVNPIAPERVLLFTHDLSILNVGKKCHDSQCFGIDLDLEICLTFNQPLIVCTLVDGNIMLQCIPKTKPRKRLKFFERLKASCMMS